MGPGTETAWQHDGRVLPDGEVTFFDDGSNPPIHSQSRGVRITLDFKAHEARLASAYAHANPPLLAASQGNMQTLADGNAVVGYGGVPAISEYATGGTLLFDADLPFDMSFYRAYRFPWSGRPSTPPAVLASLNVTGEETIVHASWNGATEVAAVARARRQAPRGAGRADHDPRRRLRELDHPARKVRLRGGAGARLGRSRARHLADGQGDQLRRLAAEPGAGRMTLSRPVWSCACAALWWSSQERRSWPAWRWSSRLCRRTPPVRQWQPGRPLALAWRSVAFFSSAVLHLSIAGSGAHPTRRSGRRSQLPNGERGARLAGVLPASPPSNKRSPARRPAGFATL